MKTIIEFSFTAEVETENSKAHIEIRNKARELLMTKLPPDVRKRKVELTGKQDKMSIKVRRKSLHARVTDVKDDVRQMKAQRKTAKEA